MASKTTKKATTTTKKAAAKKVTGSTSVESSSVKGTAIMERRGLTEDFKEIYICTGDDGTTFTFETNRRRWLLAAGDSVLKGDVEDTIAAKSCVITDCRYKVDGFPKQIIFAYYPGGEFVLDRPEWYE